MNKTKQLLFILLLVGTCVAAFAIFPHVLHKAKADSSIDVGSLKCPNRTQDTNNLFQLSFVDNLANTTARHSYNICFDPTSQPQHIVTDFSIPDASGSNYANINDLYLTSVISINYGVRICYTVEGYPGCHNFYPPLNSDVLPRIYTVDNSDIVDPTAFFDPSNPVNVTSLDILQPGQ